MYRDYGNFDVQSFRKNQGLGAHQNNHFDCSAFESFVETVLNRHASLKKKYVRANDGPFMTKLRGKLSCHAHNYEVNIARKGLREFQIKCFQKTEKQMFRIIAKSKI